MLITNLKVVGYSTGCYGDKNADGITLQFIQGDTELDYYTIFNVDCSRLRAPNRGKRRPGGQSSVRKKHAFYKFWHSTCGLLTPSKGLTTFHDCMGRLKAFTFQAETKDGKRLLKHTLQIMPPDKALITARQVPDKVPIMSPDKEVVQSEPESDFEEILTTCETHHVISKQGKTRLRVPLPTTDTSYESANKVWLDQCEDFF